MQDNVIDGLTTAATHPVTVQVINQGPGIWGNVATGAITAVAAIIAVMLTHRYTLWREERTAAKKQKQEQRFIATELIFQLEQYAEGCAQVACDKGKMVRVRGKQPERAVVAGYPAPLDFNNVAGDWRSLPPDRMYNIRELPLRQAAAMKDISNAQQHATAGQYPEYFSERQYQFACLGRTAIFEARQLRELCKLRPAANWETQPEMQAVYSRERAKRLREHFRSHDDSI